MYLVITVQCSMVNDSYIMYGKRKKRATYSSMKEKREYLRNMLNIIVTVKIYLHCTKEVNRLFKVSLSSPLSFSNCIYSDTSMSC